MPYRIELSPPESVGKKRRDTVCIALGLGRGPERSMKMEKKNNKVGGSAKKGRTRAKKLSRKPLPSVRPLSSTTGFTCFKCAGQ